MNERKLIEDMLDQLCAALCFVEDTDESFYKPGVVKKRVEEIKAVIRRAVEALA